MPLKEKIKHIKEGLAKEEVIKENMKPEQLANDILRVFDSSAIAERLSPEIFTKKFYIAHQFQESRYKEEAESSSGAKGVYQNRPESIMDVGAYLDTLRKRGEIDYQGPAKIGHGMAKKIADLFKKNADYGRAVGKLYLLTIYDPEYKYNQSPNKNVFVGNSAKETQRKLLVAYHDGPSARFKSDKRLIADARKRKSRDDAVSYYKAVFDHMESVEAVKNCFKAKGYELDRDYPIVLVLRELDRKENKRKDKKAAIHKCIEKIYAKTQEKGKPLNDIELRQIFEPDFKA